MPKKNKNTAEMLIECLEAHGVSYIFGVPGEEILTLLEAIRKSKINFITTRTEQGAAFMAATFGRLTGKVGVALSTLGPGATNLMTGVAYAQLGGFSLLVITGQKPIKKSKQGKFQIIDIVAMMRPITKYSATVTDKNKLPSMLNEAIILAETERPGAVHLELPEDVAEEVCNATPIFLKKINYPVADTRSIREALNVIEKSKHPIVILGAGVNRKFIHQEISAFFKKTGIPFITTQMGKGAFDENSRLFVGSTGIFQGDFAHLALRQADMIIIIGHDVVNTPPIILTQQNLPNTKIIHINYFSSVAKDVYEPNHEVIGDISKTLSVMTKKIKVSTQGGSASGGNPFWDFEYFFKVRDMLKQNVEKFSKSSDFPLRPERIISDIQKVVTKNDILALDNGMYKIYFSRAFITRKQNGLLLDNTLATMGAGLSSGIALKMLYPNKKVLVVAGDGGFMMSLAELETAIRLKINLVVLILDDSGYGMISWKQKKMNLPDFGLSFINPNFVMLAKSFGATGYKVSKAKDLLPILKKALESRGVHIIACPINYDEANKNLASPVGYGRGAKIQ